jgi:hypothetical protein
MESAHYTNRTSGTQEAGEVYNESPLTLAPYSGKEARVQALTKLLHQANELEIRIEVEDLFGKTYRLEVLSKA